MRLFLSVLISGLFACSPEPKPEKSKRAVYYWRTEFRLSAPERQLVDKQIDRLYLRFFDLAPSDAGPVPNAILTITDTLPAHLEVVPVVYLVNQHFNPEMDWLANKLVTLIQEKYAELGKSELTEVQFDCDWTATTREEYFTLLREVKKRLSPNTKLSVTLRLHQLKDPAGTGVPTAADRAMLMLYNTGNIADPAEENSILSDAGIHKWLSGTRKYPLPMDVVLPAYRWAAVYRLGAFHHVMQGFGDADFMDTTRFSALGNHRYLTLRGTQFHGYYLHRDDLIRVEAPDTELRKKALQTLKQNMKQPIHHLAYYHLDSLTAIQLLSESE